VDPRTSSKMLNLAGELASLAHDDGHPQRLLVTVGTGEEASEVDYEVIVERRETLHVYVITEHDLDDNASEVIAVVADDSELALDALWDAYHRYWFDLNPARETQSRNDAWFQKHGHRFQLLSDHDAEVTSLDDKVTWRIERRPIQAVGNLNLWERSEKR
jgi:hypothetical protein